MRISSIDCFRVVAILAVLAIHSHYYQYIDDYAKWECHAAVILNQAARFAVPFFFVVSGYLLGRDVRRGREPVAVAMASLRKLGGLFLAWSLLFVTADLAGAWLTNPSSFSLRDALPGLGAKIVGGPRIHLWFLPALLVGLLVAAMTSRLGALLQMMAAVALYAIGLAAGAYSTLTGLDLGLNSRNGPFFSTLFVVSGFQLGRSGFSPSLKQALALLGLGVLLQALEVYYLTQVLDVSPFGIDFVIGTVPLGLGVAWLALSRPHLGDSSAFSRIGPLVLGIYLLHLDVEKLLGAVNPVHGFAGQLALIAASFGVSLGIILVARRWRWGQWLFALRNATAARTQGPRALRTERP
jgi:surface polysaccharide O-acyltransferase-like enzyme